MLVTDTHTHLHTQGWNIIIPHHQAGNNHVRFGIRIPMHIRKIVHIPSPVLNYALEK